MEDQVPILEIALSQQCQHLEMRTTKRQFGNSSLWSLLVFPMASHQHWPEINGGGGACERQRENQKSHLVVLPLWRFLNYSETCFSICPQPAFLLKSFLVPTEGSRE